VWQTSNCCPGCTSEVARPQVRSQRTLWPLLQFCQHPTLHQPRCWPLRDAEAGNPAPSRPRPQWLHWCLSVLLTSNNLFLASNSQASHSAILHTKTPCSPGHMLHAVSQAPSTPPSRRAPRAVPPPRGGLGASRAVQRSPRAQCQGAKFSAQPLCSAI
jgi:hypothetical protein